MEKIFIICLCFVAQNFAQYLSNCSTISLTSVDTVILGRNHDGNISNCLIVFNPCNLIKEGFEFPNENISKWTSKYSSITFNILGVGFAVLGMNEKGLSIGHMGFSEAKYPPKDERPVLDQIQFITYVLDNCANTKEVINTSNEIRISDESYTREHYFVCDKFGELATIEFIEGKMVLHTNDIMPFPILSNDSYIKSMNYLKSYSGFGGDKTIPERTFGVEEIIAIGCNRIDLYNKLRTTNIIESAFSILNDIGFNKYPPPDNIKIHPNYGTQFTVVFDLKNLKVFFKTKSYNSTREIDFDFFSADCVDGMNILEIEKTEKGNVNNLFNKYTFENNRNYLLERYKNSKEISKEVIEFLAQYPESFICK
ncbi:MAG: linear amide C-N hydrolase [Ignavibacteriales bacterium]|nr:linear amide C-N hydrolase [Ignavibacteriales bacterium]